MIGHSQENSAPESRRQAAGRGRRAARGRAGGGPACDIRGPLGNATYRTRRCPGADGTGTDPTEGLLRCGFGVGPQPPGARPPGRRKGPAWRSL